MERNCVLLDTSFFIRLFLEEDPLHQNALDYFKYFLQNQYILKASTITIAEYCVRGTIDELPLINLQIVPFNIIHAIRAGELANIVFTHRNALPSIDRRIITNDTKLFAQADADGMVQKFVTADVECIKVFNLIKEKTKINFEIINIRNPYNESFGILDLK